MTSYELIIFDLDGTLVHSIEDYTDATNRLLEEYGRDPVSVETVTYQIGHGLRQFVLDLFPTHTHNDEGMALIGQKFFNYYDQVCLNKAHLYEGVEEFLCKWPGHKAVVTNKMETHALKMVEHLMPQQDFVAVFGADSLPERKPHPMPLQAAIKKCKAETSIMVGDSSPDILSSKAAGIESVAVTYGYGDQQEWQEHGPDHIIDQFSQLNEIVYG